MLTISAQLITGIIWNSKETINSSISNLIFMLLSWTVIVLMRWRASLIMGEGLRHDLAKVSALRGGKKYDINEEDIMVGDLLLIDFNQIIPVSGILISDQ
jgi:magnesium-transporting ATPase (P-type)